MDTRSYIKVELFASPGCQRCRRAKQVLKQVTEEIGEGHIQWREVNVLEELDYAVSLGVLSTTAIAIDGKLVFATLPSAGKLRKALKARLARTRVPKQKSK